MRLLIAISEASTTVAMSTATQYTDIPLCSSTALLTYTSVFKPLLRSSALTHVLSLTAFCFYILTYNFLRSTPLNPHFPSPSTLLPLPWVTLSPHVLQHKATAISIICFRASDFQHSHGIWTCQWQFLHTLLYQNRYNQFNAEPHWPIPWKLHQF